MGKNLIYFLIDFEKTGDFREKQAQIITLIEASLKSIEDGSMKVSLLKLVHANQETFLELLNNFADQLTFKNIDDIKPKMKRILNYRLHELNNFIAFYELINEFYIQYLARSSLSKNF
jgi:hypothetical protein